MPFSPDFSVVLLVFLTFVIYTQCHVGCVHDHLPVPTFVSAPQNYPTGEGAHRRSSHSVPLRIHFHTTQLEENVSPTKLNYVNRLLTEIKEKAGKMVSPNHTVSFSDLKLPCFLDSHAPSVFAATSCSSSRELACFKTMQSQVVDEQPLERGMRSSCNRICAMRDSESDSRRTPVEPRSARWRRKHSLDPGRGRHSERRPGGVRDRGRE